MDQARYEIAPGIWLDARKALWLAQARTLAVADLHLGYAWAHRHAGQLMPIGVADDTVERLTRLQQEYEADQIILLGDIVHRAVPLAPIREELAALLRAFSGRTKVTLVVGNHDRNLQSVLLGVSNGLPVSPALLPHLKLGKCLFLHGDSESVASAGGLIESGRNSQDWMVIGHEHPSVTLSDGAATWQKFPCFLVCDQMVVLPAFSRWAAGNSSGDYLSPLLQCASVNLRVAILGDRLVPINARQ